MPVPIGGFIWRQRAPTGRRVWTSIVALASSAALVSVPAAAAAPGDVDPSFGTGGKVITDIEYARGNAVAIQSNGKIVVGGQAGYPFSTFALARYLPDGSLDPVFGGDGIVTTDFGTIPARVSGLAIQADGRIVAAGAAGSDFAIARYRRDGGLDTTFSDDGKATVNLGAADTATDLAIQADGKIVLCGYAEVPLLVDSMFALARLDKDGSLDTSFGGDGTVTTDFGSDTNSLDYAYGVALQSDGRIVAAGTSYGAGAIDFALARYDTNGSLDPTFDGDGKVVTDLADSSDHASDVALQPNGKIVAAGSTSSNEGDFALVRYNPDGSLDARSGDWPLDTSFDEDGKVTTDFPHPPGFGEGASALAIQGNGKIVVAGSALGGFALARYTYDGSLDPTFGAGGLVTTAFEGYALSDAAIQADGAIVVVGTAHDSDDYGFAAARYLGDPTVPPGQGVPPGAP